MSQEPTIEQQYKTFIEKAVETGKVWFLDHEEDGTAMSTSNDDEDIGVVPFWSDKALAQVLAKDEWAKYEIVALDLPLFLENTIIQLFNDEIMIGTNWDESLSGTEINPVLLALDLIAEVKAKGKKLSFEHYKDLAEYEEVTQDAAESLEEDA